MSVGNSVVVVCYLLCTCSICTIVLIVHELLNMNRSSMYKFSKNSCWPLKFRQLIWYLICRFHNFRLTSWLSNRIKCMRVPLFCSHLIYTYISAFRLFSIIFNNISKRSSNELLCTNYHNYVRPCLICYIWTYHIIQKNVICDMKGFCFKQ